MEINDREMLDFSSLWIGFLNDSYPDIPVSGDSKEGSGRPLTTDEEESSEFL
ncbi:hypothetical protein ACQKP0_19375 [Heyndrickxia sp. NPDC080065]|uniref:hypothetical protein n=1 Tax=Heyndrickxia sp. NPDC080065 TaxID=3390568 RepID=UPI003D053F15